MIRETIIDNDGEGGVGREGSDAYVGEDGFCLAFCLFAKVDEDEGCKVMVVFVQLFFYGDGVYEAHVALVDVEGADIGMSFVRHDRDHVEQTPASVCDDGACLIAGECLDALFKALGPLEVVPLSRGKHLFLKVFFHSLEVTLEELGHSLNVL